MIKTFEVDWDNAEDVAKLFARLRTRNNELSRKRESKKELAIRRFDACKAIIDTDISSCYENMSLDPTRKYYVYAHCDSSSKLNIKSNKDGVLAFLATLGFTHYPFYVGKGTGDRAFFLNRNDTHRKIKQRILSEGRDIEVTIIKNNLTEKEALMLESKFIDILGIKANYGSLCNLDEGVNIDERRSYYQKALDDLSKSSRKINR